MERVYKRVSDIVKDVVDIDNMVKVDEVMDKDILIQDIGERTGETGIYLIVSFKYKDTDKKVSGFTCGGAVVIKKLQQVKEAKAFPILAKIVKVKKYYNIV